MLELNPDIKFKQELTKLSKAPLNECMQCGTCSIVCSLAPDEKPFPRKEMGWAGWGLKDRLIAHSDVWLCHQCGDCSIHCPRQVRPADVLAAVRQLTYKEFSKPKFLGKILSNVKWLPVAILIPVIIIATIISLAGTFKIPGGPVNYSLFFPHAWLNSSFTIITLAVYGLAVSGLVGFWRQMKSQFSENLPKHGIIGSFMSVKNKILLHTSFDGCKTQKTRKLAHLLVFYGFILLLAVTAYAIVAAITHNYPLRLTNPFKITGNIAALMLTIGLGIMIYTRLFRVKMVGKSNYSDWLLLISMFLLTLSGVIVEMARFQDWATAYHWYFFHLVCVWFVIIYLPYTKFGHILYRTLALTFAYSTERKQ
jgi:quinone-modifying oxidoreductase, subunit QmoC